MYHVLSDLPGAAGSTELREFVRACGMRPEWVQYPGTYREHFDALERLGACLMRHGARVVGNHEVALLLRARRTASVGEGLVGEGEEEGKERE